MFQCEWNGNPLLYTLLSALAFWGLCFVFHNCSAVADAANRDTTTPVTAFPVTAPFSPTQSSFTTSTAPATSDVPVTLNLTTDAGLGVYINGNKTIASLSFLPSSQSVTFTLTADAQEATSRRRASLSLFCCSPACPDCAVNRFNDTVVQVSVEVEISESYNATSLTGMHQAIHQSLQYIHLAFLSLSTHTHTIAV